MILSLRGVRSLAIPEWEDVPILIPEVNADHTRLIDAQQKQHGWSGFIVTNPNCTSTGLTIAFRALHDAFHIKFANLAHNTIRGAASGAILNGELLEAEGRI